MKLILTIFFLSFCYLSAVAQDDLLAELEELEKTVKTLSENAAAAKTNESFTSSSSSSSCLPLKNNKIMSVAQLNGELLQIKAKISDSEVLIAKQQKQMENLQADMNGIRDGTTEENLRKEIADLIARDSERDTKTEMMRRDAKMIMKRQDNTIARLIEEIENLRSRKQGQGDSEGDLIESPRRRRRLAKIAAGVRDRARRGLEVASPLAIRRRFQLNKKECGPMLVQC